MMKRLLLALCLAALSLTLLPAAATHAAPPDQRGTRPGKFLRPGGYHIESVAEMLDMRPHALLAELREGATIADLAAERDVPVDAIEDALAAPRRERLARAVQEGTLTPEQAEYLTTQADARLRDFLTLPPRHALRQPLLEDFAQALGISEDEIVAQLESGSTLAAIVAASGQDAQSVIAEMVALKRADLEQRVALDLMTETNKNRALRAYERLLTNRLTP